MKHLSRKYLKVALLFSNLNACMGAETSLFSNLSTEIVEHIGEYVAGPISKDGAINLTDWNALYQTSKKNCKSLQRQEKKYIDAKAQQYTTKAFKFYRTVLNAYLYSPRDQQITPLYIEHSIKFNSFFSIPITLENNHKIRYMFSNMQEKIKNILEVFLVRVGGTMYCRYPEIINYPTYRYTIHFYKAIQSILEGSTPDSDVCISYPSMNYTDEKAKTITQSKNFKEMYVSGIFKDFDYQNFIRLSIESPSFIPELKEENSEKNKEFVLNIQKILQGFKSQDKKSLKIIKIFKLEAMKEFYTAWLQNWVNDYRGSHLSEVSRYKEGIKILNLENDTSSEDLKQLSEQEKNLYENKEKISAIFEDLNDEIQSLKIFYGKDLKNKFKEIFQKIEEKSRAQGRINIMEEKYRYDLLKSKIDTIIRAKIKRIYKDVQEFQVFLKILRAKEDKFSSLLNEIPSGSFVELDQIVERIKKLHQECAHLNFDFSIFDNHSQMFPYMINWQSPEFKRFMDFYNGPYLLKKNTIAQEEKMIMEDFEQYCANNSPDDSGSDSDDDSRSDSDSDESKSVSAQEPSVKKQKFNP